MKSALAQVSRLDSCSASVCRMVHTCYNFHQFHYQPVTPDRVDKHLLPMSGSSLRHPHLPRNNRLMASPATELPAFESAENFMKSFLSLGQKKKDGDKTNLRHLKQLHQLVDSLRVNPELARNVWKIGLVPKLIEFSKCGATEFERQARMALSLVGHAPPYSGRGLRILSVDGGGTRLANVFFVI